MEIQFILSLMSFIPFYFQVHFPCFFILHTCNNSVWHSYIRWGQQVGFRLKCVGAHQQWDVDCLDFTSVGTSGIEAPITQKANSLSGSNQFWMCWDICMRNSNIFCVPGYRLLWISGSLFWRLFWGTLLFLYWKLKGTIQFSVY